MTSRPIIPADTKRVFIGIPVNGQSQKQINELLKPIKHSSRPASPIAPTGELPTLQDVRWVPEENRHLTLAFLGDKPVSEVRSLLELFDETYQRQTCFQYHLSLLTRFPDAKGRIIALTGDATGPLEDLYNITLDFLRANHVEFDRKRFRPHLTLGRIRKPKQVKTNFDRAVNISLDISSVRFYKSTFTQSGPIYQVLSECRLMP